MKREMLILIPVNCERTNLYSVKRDLDPPFTTLQNAAFCEKSFGKNRALYVYLTYKDADRFRKGSLHELYCSKGHQISKVRARFCEIAINGPCTSSNMLEEHFSC